MPTFSISKGYRARRRRLRDENACRAYEHHILMLTPNLAFEECTEIFGSERLTGPLLDQLIHRCHIMKRAEGSKG